MDLIKECNKKNNTLIFDDVIKYSIVKNFDNSYKLKIWVKYFLIEKELIYCQNIALNTTDNRNYIINDINILSINIMVETEPYNTLSNLMYLNSKNFVITIDFIDMNSMLADQNFISNIDDFFF